MSEMILLPDSRLKTPKDTVMGDFELSDGRTVRIEWEPAYCAQCGKLYAMVPKENTTFVFCLCQKCYKALGEQLISGHYWCPDDEFAANVVAEMDARFKRTLTDQEVYDAALDGNLGKPLEALMRDSIFPANDNRPKR